MPTRNAHRWSPPPHHQDPTATPRAWSRGAFAPKPLLAQKRPSPAARRAQIVPYARHARRSRAYSPASLSASSPRTAARSSGLCSKFRASHAIALLVTSRHCRPFSEIANSRNSGVCPEIFFSGRIVPNMLHAGMTRHRAHCTTRTLRTHTAAALVDNANERGRARRRLECGDEPGILVHDAEQLIECRRMRDRRLQADSDARHDRATMLDWRPVFWGGWSKRPSWRTHGIRSKARSGQQPPRKDPNGSARSLVSAKTRDSRPNCLTVVK